MKEPTEQEIEVRVDRQMGERFASDAIALACRLHGTPEKQAHELRYWFEFYKAFPASAVYSLPILATEINRLEENS